MQARGATELQSIIDAALHGQLDEALAGKLHKLGPEAVTLASLAMSRHIGEQRAALARLEGRNGSPSPSTPSGMVPIYTKPNTSKRRKKPGARKGQQGVRRKKPTRVDGREDHRLKGCPCCGGPLQRCERSRKHRLRLEGLGSRIAFHGGR